MPSLASLLRFAFPAVLLAALGLFSVPPAAAVFDSALFNAGSGALEIVAINPAGEDVPPARELVLRFNRPVVPVGRMERDAAEIPVEITPPLACEWRWLDTANLACRLGEKSEMTPATLYTVTVRPGIKAEDGATLAKTLTHTFITARPLVVDYDFLSWRSPGMPVILVRFNQPVSAASAAQHLYFATGTQPRLAAQVVEDRGRAARPPTVGGGEYEAAEEDGATAPLQPEEEGVFWLISPQQEFPLDSAVEMRVEPGVTAQSGEERGIEERTVVAFNTFPEFAFLGIQCQTNAGDELLFTPGQQPVSGQFCTPHGQVALLFSAPVAPRVLNEALRTIPQLPKVETEEWEGDQDFAVGQPHRPGSRYSMVLPYWYEPYQPYTLRASGAVLRDVFDRPLPQDIRQMFFTDHYRPSFSFGHQVSVLEKGVASEVPIEIRNLTRIDLNGVSLTTAGRTEGLKRSLLFAEEKDRGFRVPLDLRKLLGASSGAVAGHFETVPDTSHDGNYQYREFFAQVTPYNVQAKIGHFNTLVWITDYATGLPVEGVETRIYRAPFPGLVPHPEVLARGRSDRNGLVLLPGTEQLDPGLASLEGWRRTSSLFVRCDKGGDLALLPLTHDFSTRQYYETESGEGYGWLRRKFGHVRAWGMTAQGVYRAGDTIQYKLYVRNQDNRALVAPPQGGYALRVVDPMDQTVHTVDKLTLSEFGAYSGEFTVPASAPVGWYRFELSADFGGSWEPMRVLVSDFTPAPFRVTTELNGELLRAGETVKVATHARLHAGGPYADAGSRVVARLFPAAFSSKHPRARDFEFDTSTQGYEVQTIHESERQVDAAGDRATTFRLDAANVLYGRLVVESAVRDDRGKYVAGETSARFVGRDRFVGLHQPDWVLRQGTPAQLEALVVNEFGDPVAGTSVEITVQARETTASRVKGAGNAYLTHYDHRWVEVARSTLTPGAAGATMTFTPDRPGLYALTATISDTAGRQHRTTLERWAAGSGAVIWEGGDDNALRIIPEKQELKVGDKARYLVQNPFPGAKALITVERYGVLKSWVETFSDSTAVVEVPVEADYVPGFYLSVTVFSPRVDKPVEGQVDLGKPAFRIGTVATPVRDPYKELVVTAKPERATYKPREKATVDLQVTTRQKNGKLPPTELAVVVLDEAVLDLIQGGRNYYDVYKGFYSLEPLDLRTYNLLLQLVGRQKFDKKGASPGGDGGADLAMRSRFKFVSYWNPALRTDAKGKARISFEVPDNLTGWRVLALAVTPGDRLGLGDGSFQVNRPTELRPALPNQVTEGDRFSAGFSVMNRTATERTLKVKITAEGALAEPAVLEQTVAAAPYKRVELRLPVATKGAGEVRLTARAYDASDGDLTVATVPVRKQIVTETAATYGTTTAAQVEERIAVPKEIRTDVGSVSVVASPTVIGNIEGAFAYLRDYPYICWEQQLTKGVMASHYRQLRPWLPTSFSWPEAEQLPATTLGLAAAHQAPNGGMVYYVPEDQYVSPYLSAYTALAFNWLRAAGHPVPQPVEERLHNYLRELLRRDELPSFYDRGMASTVRAVALAALAQQGKLTRADVERFRPHLIEMSLFGKAHYLSALVQIPGTEALRAEAAKAILAHAEQSGGKFVFSETLALGYERIHASTIRDNAAILSALVAYGETPDGARLVGDVPFKLVRAITQGRGQRDRWENTQENMFCMNALIEYSRLYEKDKPAMAVRAYLDDAAFGATRFAAFTDPPQTFERPLVAADPGRKAVVRLEKEGSGRLYYATRLTWAPLELAAKPANAGMELRREYSVERKGKWALLASPMQIRSGELVRVDLYLSLPAARNFVVVDDPVPGGLEPVNRDLATTSNVDADKGEVPYAGGSWWFRFNDWNEYGVSFWSFYHRELRHHAARFYSEYLPPGNYHLSYTAQAIAPGDFTVMPAKAEEMYDPDVFGRTAPARLKVER